jgi:hypothetical protein
MAKTRRVSASVDIVSLSLVFVHVPSRQPPISLIRGGGSLFLYRATTQADGANKRVNTVYYLLTTNQCAVTKLLVAVAQA